MTQIIETEEIEITKKVVAIVQFGPPTASTGFRPAEYFMVTLDPNMASPGGKFLRFDQRFQDGCELHGWQRIDALTVCEILRDADDYPKEVAGYKALPGATLKMMAVK